MPSSIQCIIQQDNAEANGWWLDDAEPFLPQDLMAFLKSFHSFLMDFDSWWKQPLSDSQEVLNTTQEDLHILKKSCETLNLAVGKPIQIQGMDFLDLWTAIEFLGTLPSTNTDITSVGDQLNRLQQFSKQIPALWDEAAIVQGELVSVQDTLDKFEHHFRVISPLLQGIKTMQICSTP
jgi:hypothetical protein